MNTSKIIPINEMPPLKLVSDEQGSQSDARIQIKRMVQIARWENHYLVKTISHSDPGSSDVLQTLDSIRNVRNQFMDLARKLKNSAVGAKMYR